MMLLELKQRRLFFDKKDEIETIYFGGGTPSLLSIKEIEQLLERVHANYSVIENPEITLECNPDDLSKAYLKGLKELGVNRLSVGIQSFDDDILKWMNRSHNAKQSLDCIKNAGDLGFRDLTIDLIYGVPGLSNRQWQETVDFSLHLPINHISAYGLTLEEKTPYARLVKQKKYKQPDDESVAEHYEILIQRTEKLGWEHYEVSNFCKLGNYSKHNTAYWQQKKYLGVGPSAHSFDLKNRYWNLSSNKDYIDKLSANEKYFEFEELSVADKVNELLLTGLRTKWGVNVQMLEKEFGYDVLQTHKDLLEKWVLEKDLILEEGLLKLTPKGWLFADYISSQLFVEEGYSSHTSS
jgi:oxygen-independent coproporphyrinogen-3 oxidase